MPEMESDDEDPVEEAEAATGILSFLKNLTTQKAITRDSLEPVLRTMMEHLIQKNVAADIAANLCESVAKSLVGTKIGTFISK